MPAVPGFGEKRLHKWKQSGHGGGVVKLEDITVGAVLTGLLANQPVTVRQVQRFGEDVLWITSVDAEGRPGEELLYRDRESSLTLVQKSRPRSFTADGAIFRLVSEGNACATLSCSIGTLR